MREKRTEPHTDFSLSWSYVAGFFDAHGNIHKTKRGTFQMTFSKTNKQIIEMIRDFVSPSSNILSEDGIRFGHKKIYRLKISRHHDIIRIAKKMLPRSIVQRENLSDALWAMKNKGYRYKSRVEQRPWTEEEKIILLLTLNEPRIEVARRLGRTLGSIDQARHRLKKERCKK